MTHEHIAYGAFALVFLVSAVAAGIHVILLRGAGEAEDYGEPLSDDWSPHR